MTSYDVGARRNPVPANLVTTVCMATKPSKACCKPMESGKPTGPKTILVKAAASMTVARPLYTPAAMLPATDGGFSAAMSTVER